MRLAPFVAAALLAVLLVGLSTHWGVGTSPDSASFFSVAHNLVAGNGYRDIYGTDAALRPPLYPGLLALMGLLDLDPLITTRWLNAALFAANVVLVGLILKRDARMAWTPIVGSFLALTSVDMLEIHSMAWSEPVFIFLGLLGLLWLSAYAERRARGMLLASAAAIALTMMTRYTGLAFAATGLAVIWLLTNQKLLRKLADSALFTLTAFLPTLAWAVRNMIVGGTATGRITRFQPVLLNHIKGGLRTASLWIMPQRIPLTDVPVPIAVRIAVVLAAIVAIVLVACLTLGRRARSSAAQTGPRSDTLPLVMGLCVVLYVGLLAGYVTFSDRYAVFNLRYLSPAFLPALIFVACLGDRLLRNVHRRRVVITVGVLVTLFALWYANRAFWWVAWRHGEGLALMSKAWHNSELISRARELGPDVPIYSNAVDALYFHLDRATTQLPSKIKTVRYAYARNEHLADDLDAMRRVLEREGGVIVFFDKIKGRAYLVSQEDLERAMPLRVRTQAADGVIYEIAQ